MVGEVYCMDLMSTTRFVSTTENPKKQLVSRGTEKNNNNKRDVGGEKRMASITVVLKVDMHCDGCASKLVKTARAIQGVETVKAESESGKVTVTGDVDPPKLRDRTGHCPTCHSPKPGLLREQLEVKIKKKVELVSPQPNKEKEKEDNNKDSKDKNKEKKSEEKKPKEAPVTTAVLKVSFHRERCIEKIQKTVSKTKGLKRERDTTKPMSVSGFSIDQEKQLVTVKGTMDVKKLVRSLTEKLKRNVEIVATAKNGDAKEKQYVAAQPAHGSAYFPGEDGDTIEYLAPQIFSDDNPNACVLNTVLSYTWHSPPINKKNTILSFRLPQQKPLLSLTLIHTLCICETRSTDLSKLPISSREIRKMVSDASKKKALQKKAAAAAKRGGKAAAAKAAASSSNGADSLSSGVDAIQISDRTCTGILCSHPQSRDIRIESLSVTFHGYDLIVDSMLELNYGRRYGLLGLNGCGKSTLLTAIGLRELPIPDHMDIYHLSHEIEATDMTSLEAVMSCDEERLKLEKEIETLVEQDDGGGERLDTIYERLEAMDASTAEKRAAEILFGLGFDKEMQAKKTKDFSGGWRMRIALARALFIMPTILLLDEPTNHLDLEACVWLEESLKNFDRILVVVSHSQDFLNGVCTNIIHMQSKQLKYYTGNFDQYCQTRSELEENQMKQYRWEQEQISHMKEYIARFGHGSAKLARQAQSKEKTLAKMERGGLTEKVARDSVLVFRFADVGKLPPPVLQFVEVSFGYTPDYLIYKNIDFGVDLDSRVALVGPNGAGKSTLLKLMTGELQPTEGMVRRHNHLKIAQYHQHLAEKLDLEVPALIYMMNEFPGNEEEKMRAAIGRFGLTGKAQVMPMKNLSDGQRSRVIFAWLAYKQPNMLLLDEPTNHLDIETIDSLAEALNEWDGGLVLVSHDFRLINQVAHEIWVCEKQCITKWNGDIMDFKKHLKAKAGLED
ncbi:hypothetical protein YC2023_035089 [Brassica napus]